MCTSSGPPPESAAKAGVGPSAEIVAAASGGPVATASTARIAPSMPYWTSSCPVVAPRLRSSAISAACRSINIVETITR